MNEYVKLSQREHQLDIEEGRIKPETSVEQILDDGTIMVESLASSSSAPVSKPAHVVEDIEL